MILVPSQYLIGQSSYLGCCLHSQLVCYLGTLTPGRALHVSQNSSWVSPRFMYNVILGLPVWHFLELWPPSSSGTRLHTYISLRDGDGYLLVLQQVGPCFGNRMGVILAIINFLIDFISNNSGGPPLYQQQHWFLCRQQHRRCHYWFL